MDTIVLLKVLLICAWPCAMFLRSFRRTFLTPVRLFGGILLPLPCGGGRTYYVPRPALGGGCGRSGLLLAGLLLASHCLLLALSGARVGLRALTVHRQPATMPDALIAADLDLAPDVGLDLAAQVTFDLVIRLDPVTQPNDVVIAERVNSGIAAHAGAGQRLECPGTADAVDVGKRDLEPLVTRQVNANKASHPASSPSVIAEVVRAAPRPCPDTAPASSGGAPLPELAGSGLRCVLDSVSRLVQLLR